MEGVRMEMGAMDCSICHEPLGPRIYQCGMGHLLCISCCSIKRKKCPSPLCSRTRFMRCFGMERIAKAIKVPCCFGKNGCTEKMAYFNKAKHEKACQHGPCFCPEPGCGFTGPAAALRDHFAGRHKWPSTAFEYYAQFDLRLKPGPHVLHAKDGSSIFLVNVVPAAEPLGHAISLVCVQPEVSTDANKSMFGLSLMFSCFTGHHQVLRMEDVMSSSLADGLPKGVVYFVPRAYRDDHDVISITIDMELAFDDEELEDDDSEDENWHPPNDEDEDKDDGEDEDEDDEEEVGDDEEEDDESDDH